MPAMPKVARQTLPKNRTAPRTLSEQCGVRSKWVAASNTAATIPATLLAYSSTYELICGFFRPRRNLEWCRAGVSDFLVFRGRFRLRREPRKPLPGTTGDDSERRHLETTRKSFDIRFYKRHFHGHLVGDPPGERQSARADGLARQQSVVETAEPQADDENHRKPELFGDVSHGRDARDGREPAARAFDQHEI